MDVVSLDVSFLMAGLLGLLAGTLLGDLFAKKNIRQSIQG